MKGKHVLVLLLGLAISAGLFAAPARQSAASSGVETLEIYGMGSGILEGRFYTEIWKEDLGIIFNGIPGNEQVLNTIIASGNLPDILFVPNYTFVNTMIQAGQLLNWDDQRAKLPTVYGPYLTNAVQYRRDYVSNGTGNLYGLGVDICSNGQSVGTLNTGPYIRWDYYKELGMPPITNPEDYLSVLKRMQDAHPTTEAGQRVYAFSLFSDWDGIYPAMLGELFHVTQGTRVYGFTEFNLINNTTRTMLDDNSIYKQTLRFFYNANQLGILDPDSINQGFSDMLAKGKAGRVLFSNWPWGAPGEFRTAEREAAAIGYGMVPFGTEKVVDNVLVGQTIGDTRSYVVSKNSKHLDKALAFIDFIYSFDGILLMQQGRQGVKWDVDENGEPYYTRLGWDIANGIAEYPNGGTQSDAGGIPPGVNWRAIHPTYNRQLSGKDWIKKDYAPADSALVADWQQAMKARDDIDYFSQHNMLVAPPFTGSLVVPDNIQIILNRIGEVVTPLSWQMVYARDQAEFDRLWAQMVEQARGRGLDQADRWFREAYTAAVADFAKYSK